MKRTCQTLSLWGFLVACLLSASSLTMHAHDLQDIADFYQDSIEDTTFMLQLDDYEFITTVQEYAPAFAHFPLRNFACVIQRAIAEDRIQLALMNQLLEADLALEDYTTVNLLAVTLIPYSIVLLEKLYDRAMTLCDLPRLRVATIQITFDECE